MNKIDFIKALTALTIIGSYGLIVYALVFREIPEANRELFIHLMGIVEGTFATALVGFYWTRSHKGSNEDPTT